MGSGIAEGENRAQQAVRNALSSPLLNDNDIRGARNILLNITSGKKPVLMDEIAEITDFVQEAAGNDSDIIWGNCNDDNLGDKLMVTVIATGFETAEERHARLKQTMFKITHVDTNGLLHKNDPTEVETLNPAPETGKDTNVEIKVKHVTKLPEENTESAKQEQKQPQQFTFDFGLFSVTNEVTQESKIKDPTEDPVTENITEEEIVIEQPAITEAIAELRDEPVVGETEEQVDEKEDEPQFEIKMEIRQSVQEEKNLQNEEKPLFKKPEQKSFITNEDKMHVVQNSADDRNQRLKSMSMKLTSGNLEEIEKVPAYMRKNIDLEEPPASKELNISKYSVSEGDNGSEIKHKNNSFLHDNVD
jgi:cell division protein FtsZ